MSRFRPSRNYVNGKVVFDGGPVDITGDLIVSGTITANEYNVNVINTNVTHIDADGNTKFGDTPDDTHQFTGSVFINGPLSASSIIGGGSTSPGGADTQVQYNNAGSFGGDTDFTWNAGSSTLTVSGTVLVTGSAAELQTPEIQFDIDHTATGHSTGRIYWDDSSKTLTADMQGTDVRLQIGQEEHVYAKNTSGVPIANGDAVRISGASGTNIEIEKAIAEIRSFTSPTEQDAILGIATELIPDNQSGYITTFGQVRDLNTSGFSLGDILYLSHTVSGSYTNVRPPAPYFPARVGIVEVVNAATGIVLSRPSEPIFLTDIAGITSSNVPAAVPSYLCYDDTTEILNFTNELSGAFSGSFQGDGSGLMGITSTSPTGKMLYVDIVNGNDGTATRGDANSPYLTVASALSNALAQDAVIVRPGTYVESGLTLSSSVTLIGEGGWRNTQIGDHSATQNILEVEGLSQVDGITFLVPSSSAGYSGVFYSGSADPTFSIYNCNLYGNASTGQGIGLNKTGAGKIIGAEIRCDQGGLEYILKVDSGTTALESIHVPPSSGDISAVAFATGSGRYQLVDLNIGSSNVTDALYCDGSSTTLVFGINTFNVENSVHIASNDATAIINGGQMEETGFAVLADPALTLSNGKVRITANHNSNYSFNPAAADSDFGLSFFQEGDSTRFPQQRVFGVDSAFGFAERGSKLFSGRGPSYSTGIKVFTTDNTATSVLDGGNFIDETAAAQSREASTFTFQGTSVNHTILWTTQRLDPAGSNLKHWGIQMQQVVAGLAGSYVMEIWDGAAWTEVSCMTTSEAETYRYANNLFIRADNTEIMRLGIDDDTTWATKTINAVTGYWIRARIATTVTTLPTFQRWWVAPSFTLINAEGQRTAMGLSQWKETLVGSGNIFGESGGVVNASIAVGSGGLPTGWNQVLLNAELNGNGDAIYFQFPLPNGVCTAYPVNIKAVYSLNPVGSSPPDMICSFLPAEVAENLVADPAGGISPVPRAIGSTDTLTANAAQTSSVTVPNNTANKLSIIDFGGFDVSSYYEDDIMVMRIEMDNGNGGDVVIWSLIIEGVIFSDGKNI